MKNILFFRSLNIIGGIESHFFYLTNKYLDNDITIYYIHSDKQQLKRLQKFARCIQYSGETIECEKAFFCFNTDIWDNVKGKRYIVLHGDYEDALNRSQINYNNLPIKEDCDGYFGVTKYICESFERITGIKVKYIGQPFVKQQSKKILRLVYCGRLSKEKGSKRVVSILNELDRQGIDYEMFVYTDGSLDKKDVIYKKTRLDAACILNRNNYDYLLQCSDNEGYCYSVVEALSGTPPIPVVVTPIPVFKELGLNESNSITLNFDCSNVKEVVDQMVNKKFDFKYEPPNDRWNEELAEGESTYKYEGEKIMRIRVKLARGITFAELDNQLFKQGEVADVCEETAKKCVELDYAEVVIEKATKAEPKEEPVVKEQNQLQKKQSQLKRKLLQRKLRNN